MTTMLTHVRTLVTLALMLPFTASAQSQQHPDEVEQLIQSVPDTLSKAPGAAAGLVDSMIMSSQIIAGVQQIRSAFIWARTDSFEAHTIQDLVSRNYLKGVPPPFSGDIRIDGAVLRMSPVSLPLCLSMEQKAGRRGHQFFDSSLESSAQFGCYLSGNTPVVFHRL